jgi:perosamine synthetase
MIPVYQPFITPKTSEYAHEAIASGWLSSIGKYKELATEKLKEITGVKYVLLVNNGTSAVHLMSKSLTHFYPGITKLIVPNNVYVAAWNGFLFDERLELVPVDANIDTWNIDLDLLREYIDIDRSALLVVHNLSSIVNVPKLKRKYKQIVIFEDACEGFLGKYEGAPVGSESKSSAISFFGNKSVTSGEGGALITNSKEIYEYTKKLHGQGLSSKRYIHDVMGYNYRMTNIQAAILYGQLEDIELIKEEKERVFSLYRQLLSENKNVQLQKCEDDTVHSNWMMGVRLMNMKKSYNHLEKYFKSKGIEIRPMFYPMSKHEYLKNVEDVTKEAIASVLSEECFVLPSYPELTNKQVEKIVLTLEDYTRIHCKKL